MLTPNLHMQPELTAFLSGLLGGDDLIGRDGWGPVDLN